MKSHLKTGLLLGITVILLQTVCVYSLRCYKCTILPPPTNSNMTSRLCSHFDGSSMYEVHCPYSTFCMKKTFQVTLQKGKHVEGIERDCAAQHYTYQVYNGSQWELQNAVVATAYTEGCFAEDSAATSGVKRSSTTYCYCKSNLCNAAKATREPSSSHHTDAMAVIFVFNAMKYIRSLR